MNKYSIVEKCLRETVKSTYWPSAISLLIGRMIFGTPESDHEKFTAILVEFLVFILCINGFLFVKSYSHEIEKIKQFETEKPLKVEIDIESPAFEEKKCLCGTKITEDQELCYPCWHSTHGPWF